MKYGDRIRLVSVKLLIIVLSVFGIGIVMPTALCAQGLALQFLGQSYVNANIDSVGLNDSVTVEAWIHTEETLAMRAGKQSATVPRQFIVGIGNRWDRGYGLFMDLDYWPQIRLYAILFTVTQFSTYDTLSDMVWTHIALVRQGDNWSLFVNGVGAYLGQVNPFPLKPSDTLIVGASDLAGGEGFWGTIDEVRISTVARYKSDFTPPSAPFSPDEYTKVLYHFDDGVPDTTTVDASSNGYTGNLGAFPNNPTWVFSSAPVPIQLAGLSASAADGKVTVEWSTLSEVNNYGFYVERRSEQEAEFTGLPNNFVAGVGTTLEEQHYSWTDQTVTQGTYYYRLKQVDLNGDFTYSSVIKVMLDPLGVDQSQKIPTEYSLGQNYPSPFNPTTTISYGLPSESRVRLTVYNMLGQVIATLADGVQNAGYRCANWNAGPLASGVYIYRLEATSIADPARSFTQVRRSLLLK